MAVRVFVCAARRILALCLPLTHIWSPYDFDEAKDSSYFPGSGNTRSF